MEFRCLRYLHDNEYSLVKDLAKEMDVTPSRVTNLLNNLEMKGYIKRAVNVADRRVIKVRLTESGKDFTNYMCKSYMEFHEDILKQIKKSELKELFKNLNIFHKTISKFLASNKI